METIIHKNIYRYETHYVIVTLDGCGLVDVVVYNDCPDVAYFANISVVENKRRNGIGRVLHEKAEKLAKEIGMKRIELIADCDTWTLDWYKRLGFQFCRTEKEVIVLEKII